MKRIAIFADGTWNSPDQDYDTNVLRLAQAVKPVAGTAAKPVEQISFYDWGVGADRQKLTGGLTGAGIDKNIMDCYRFIVHNYEPGDQLFLFGFSRGAYTVRSLGGFIRNCGVLKREHAKRIGEAFQLYRKRTKNSGPDEPEAKKFRKLYSVSDITEIEFVGVWDTVGALGIPLPFWGTLGKREFLFHDTEPSKIIQHARHAVSIDETREDFDATLWSEKPGLDLVQVWFPGVHCDVGGGYEDSGLADGALNWILQEASKFGLSFESHLTKRIRPNAKGAQHNERKGIYLARGEKIREIKGPVHVSAKQRWQANHDNYQKKSKALGQLLQVMSGDWGKIPVVS